MLEIIRAYGQERLTEAADRGGGAGRAAPVARAVLHPAGRDERVLPARLPAAGVAALHEGGRCRAGRGGTGSARTILRLIGPLGVLFRGFVTGQVALQAALFDDAVADPEPWVSATALVMRGHVRVSDGSQHARAEEDFLAATGIFTALGERWGLAISLAGLAMLEGRPDDARAALRRAVEQGGPPDIAQQLRALAATGLGYLSAADGDLETARRWHAQALDTARSSSDAPGDRAGPDRDRRSRAARRRPGAGRRAARGQRGGPGNHGSFGPRRGKGDRRRTCGAG